MKLLIIIFLFTIIGCFDDSENIQKWDNNEIPYYFDENLSQKEKEYTKNCMTLFEDQTNIKFIEKNNLNDFILKIKKDDNKNNVTIGKRKKSLLKIKTFWQKTILHELCHVIGLRHEHQRPDRDQYVTILWENIIEKKQNNFKIKNDFLYDYTKYPYDYNSIMHYENNAFSKNRKFTIQCEKQIYNFTLSEIDIQKINDIYPPLN